jgi:hypothetical protein
MAPTQFDGGCADAGVAAMTIMPATSTGAREPATAGATSDGENLIGASNEELAR